MSFRLNAPMIIRLVIFHMNIFKLVVTSLVCSESKQSWYLKLKLACLLDIKANSKNKYANVLKCPLCLGSSETFSHIFICLSGLWFPKVLRGFTLESLIYKLQCPLSKLGKFSERYLEARKLLI